MSNSSEEQSDVVRARVKQNLQQYQRWYFSLGIIVLLAGFVALFIPQIIAMALELVLGVIILLYGIVRFITAIASKSHGSIWLSAIAATVIGIIMLVQPQASTLALASLVAAFLIIEGGFEIWSAVYFRELLAWGWLVLSGILAMILGLMALIGWPELTVSLLGILIAVNFIFHGVLIIMLSLAMKKS